jgi:phage terminase large subunit
MESGPQKSATHIRFRQSPPDCAKIIELNWRDNPFFPKILNTTRLDVSRTGWINTIGYGTAVFGR